MSGEEEVLILPGLPLVNLAGENPEPDLWSFEIETPAASVVSLGEDSPTAMIDYVHPGICIYMRALLLDPNTLLCFTKLTNITCFAVMCLIVFYRLGHGAP